MLRQRVATALVLLALLLPALIAEKVWPFAVLSLLAFAAGGWEWARLNDAGRQAVPLGVGLGLACVLALWAGWTTSAPRVAWWVAMGAWVLGGAWVLSRGVAGWPHVPRAIRIGVGLVALWTAWLAMANAKAGGLNFILSIFFLVWAADIFAYFGGRAFGKRKLAPAISPGKSWAGVWSGMLGALLVAGTWVFIDGRGMTYYDSLYTLVNERLTSIGLALVVVFLVAMSVVGDLFESLVKRSAGAKDSSGLLPGHGGILDRLDALLPVFPIALALASLSPS
ncbi:MAG TPA: phosphatidate cytidylyltransferase [Caldimonas sp.]|nr:phosphatidate cytidylyltransferase [Caldimonas sp.]HEX2541313.1 phosphatidate cytidylyltransferase [Caldimonas sp.]